MERRSAYAGRHNSYKLPTLRANVTFSSCPPIKNFFTILVMLLQKFKKFVKSRIPKGGRKLSKAVF